MTAISASYDNATPGNTSTDLDRYQYGYDEDSNRIWKHNTVGSSLDEFYTYDDLNRLTEMQRGTLNGGKTGISGTPTREMDYTLDPSGNWPTYLTKTSGTTDLNQSRTSNTVNEVTAIGTSGGLPLWATPAYDAAGNMTTIPQVATPTSSYTGTFDAWNRMVTLAAGSGTTYKYDGVNRRIVMVTTSPSESRHFYFNSLWQDLEEWTGSTPALDKSYVWGIRYIDELVGRYDSSANLLYAMSDANFNITSICSTAAAVQERYLYDPYGNVTYMNASWSVISASANAWIFNHQGLRQDVASGLIYNRNRMLHPGIGIFMQRDTMLYVDGPNLFEYLQSCPTTKMDSAGLSIYQIIGTRNQFFGLWKETVYIICTNCTPGQNAATAVKYCQRAWWRHLISDACLGWIPAPNFEVGMTVCMTGQLGCPCVSGASGFPIL